MPSRMLPSKLVWERYRLAFDFNTVLELNEFVVDWDVFNQALTGDDPDPDEMITTQKQLTDNVVYQWVRFGLPGVVYGFRCVAVTNLGRTVELVKKLAVLLAPAIVPPLFGISYSTTPYPILSIDSMLSDGLTQGGFLFTQLEDAINSFGSLVNGELRTIFQVYTCPPESIASTATLDGGVLATPLVTYGNGLPESITSQGVVLNGVLLTILITYSNALPESITSSGELTGGSLV